MALVASASIALADMTIKDGSGTSQTLHMIDSSNSGTSACGTTVKCSANVFVDATGAPYFTSGNPGFVTITNTNANVNDNADSIAPTGSGFGSPVVDHLYGFDGTNWDRVRITSGGNLVLVPYSLSVTSNNNQGSSTTTTAITVQSASGNAGLKEYMSKLSCGRSDAGTTAITLAISDATTTVTKVLPNNGGGGVVNYAFDPPRAWAANHAVTVTPSSGVTTLYCDATGYNAP